jgi:hypothetical protein
LSKFNERIAELEKGPVFFLLMVKPLPLIRDFPSWKIGDWSFKLEILPESTLLFHSVLSNFGTLGALTDVVFHETFKIVIFPTHSVSPKQAVGKSPVISPGTECERFEAILFTSVSGKPPLP